MKYIDYCRLAFGWLDNKMCMLFLIQAHKICTTIEGELFEMWFRAFKSLRLYGQATKRTWWMPWQPEAMKDVVGNEMLRGAVKQALIRRCPNGETRPIYGSSHAEYIGM